MSDHEPAPRPVSRITCWVPHQTAPRITETLRRLNVSEVITESARDVRRRRYRSRGRVTRNRVRTEDSPVDVFRLTTGREDAPSSVQALIEAADLEGPGRGTIFVQHAQEYVDRVQPWIAPHSPARTEYSSLLSDLALITCVLSARGSGEQLAELALELGTGVPLVTLGRGTGMRDRLGLLRITVPPEKELVHLLVPALDAEGVVRQLVEEGRLNAPGRGFVYCTAVHEGLLDTSLQVGPQEHAATMEQVVAAIDRLYAGTAWRRRFARMDEQASFGLQRQNSEIALVCAEEWSELFINAALRAGARGGTTTRVRRLRLDDASVGDAARERSIISVPAATTESIVQAIAIAGAEHPEWLDSLQVAPSPIVFTYHR